MKLKQGSRKKKKNNKSGSKKTMIIYFALMLIILEIAFIIFGLISVSKEPSFSSSGIIENNSGNYANGQNNWENVIESENSKQRIENSDELSLRAKTSIAESGNAQNNANTSNAASDSQVRILLLFVIALLTFLGIAFLLILKLGGHF